MHVFVKNGTWFFLVPILYEYNLASVGVSIHFVALPLVTNRRRRRAEPSLILCFYRCTKKSAQAVCFKTLWRRKERRWGQAVLKVPLLTSKGKAICIFIFTNRCVFHRFLIMLVSRDFDVLKTQPGPFVSLNML